MTGSTVRASKLSIKKIHFTDIDKNGSITWKLSMAMSKNSHVGFPKAAIFFHKHALLMAAPPTQFDTTVLLPAGASVILQDRLEPRDLVNSGSPISTHQQRLLNLEIISAQVHCLDNKYPFFSATSLQP